MISKQIYGFLKETLLPGVDRELDDQKMSDISSKTQLTPSRVGPGDLVYLKYRNTNNKNLKSTKEHLVIISAMGRAPSGYGINLSTGNRVVAGYLVYPSSPETLRIILNAIYKNSYVSYGKGVMSNMFKALFGPRRFRTYIQYNAFDINKIDFRLLPEPLGYVEER